MNPATAGSDRPYSNGTHALPMEASTCLSAVDIERSLRAAGVRPTRQRLAIGSLLFAKGHRHVSAETLLDEAMCAGINISLATIYNCLHMYSEYGMVRELHVDAAITYYDTNTSDHCHFISQVDGSITDVPAAGVHVGGIKGVPEGWYVADVQIVARLRSKGG